VKFVVLDDLLIDSEQNTDVEWSSILNWIGIDSVQDRMRCVFHTHQEQSEISSHSTNSDYDSVIIPSVLHHSLSSLWTDSLIQSNSNLNSNSIQLLINAFLHILCIPKFFKKSTFYLSQLSLNFHTNFTIICTSNQNA